MPIDPVTELQRAMALVRPAGMSDEAMRDWLAAAAAEIYHLPPHVMAEACAEARRTVNHHSQIIPAILASPVVKSHQAHERMIAGLLRDGHQIPNRTAPRLEQSRGPHRIGHVLQTTSFEGEA